MITYALAGIVLLVMVLGLFSKWSKIAIVALIPLGALLWFSVNTKIPDLLGYPLETKFIGELPNSLVLFGVQGADTIYLMIVIDGDKQPRLISMPATEANRKAFKTIQEARGKGGAPMVRGTKKQGPNQEMPEIELVPLKEQPVEEKNG